MSFYCILFDKSYNLRVEIKRKRLYFLFTFRQSDLCPINNHNDVINFNIFSKVSG